MHADASEFEDGAHLPEIHVLERSFMSLLRLVCRFCFERLGRCARPRLRLAVVFLQLHPRGGGIFRHGAAGTGDLVRQPLGGAFADACYCHDCPAVSEVRLHQHYRGEARRERRHHEDASGHYAARRYLLRPDLGPDRHAAVRAVDDLPEGRHPLGECAVCLQGPGADFSGGRPSRPGATQAARGFEPGRPGTRRGRHPPPRRARRW
mmetsp:Transcript_26383/g.87461  ORF Transcript_26383/g.87461 Transcript_26383/m.87461 type:complete len:207 (-) Transcript_26383:106-726(-)